MFIESVVFQTGVKSPVIFSVSHARIVSIVSAYYTDWIYKAINRLLLIKKKRSMGDYENELWRMLMGRGTKINQGFVGAALHFDFFYRMTAWLKTMSVLTAF